MNVNFSSVFNTMQTHMLLEKLITHFHLNNQLVLWILSFLTNQSQRVLVNNSLSNALLTSTLTMRVHLFSPCLHPLHRKIQVHLIKLPPGEVCR